MENTLVPSVKLKMAIAKQKKKSDTSSASSTLPSSVSAWALSLRYGNKAETLKFVLVPNLPVGGRVM